MRVSVAEGIAFVLGAVLLAAPLANPWPVPRNLWASFTGDPSVYASGLDEQMAQRVLWCALFGVLAVIVGTKNRWLGGVVGLLGLHVLLREQTDVSAVIVAVMLVGVVSIASAPRTHAPLVAALVALGLLQACYSVLQLAGYDLLRGAAQIEAFGRHATGTLGQRGHVGAILAMTGALAPVWALPLFVIACVGTKSLGACAALGLALAWRGAGWLRVVALAFGTTLGVVALAVYRGAEPFRLRGEAYRAGALDWIGSAFMTGFGLGGWAQRLPASTVYDGTYPSVWTPAHSDVLQWGYETGAVGMILLGGFAWSARRMFGGLYGPALAALAVVSFVEFPFHSVTPGVAGAVVLGLGLSTTQHTGA